MTQPASSNLTTEAAIIPGTLRAAMEARRDQGETFSVREMVAAIIPLCSELIARHARGETFCIHPSNVRFDAGSPIALDLQRAKAPPTLPRDKACMAPEERHGKGGDACSSVFNIGAIAYEMLTGTSVGPAMRRPSELVSNLPANVDVILSKALIGDPSHRPHDLAALAQAIHHLAPTASQAPPPANEAALDGDDDFSVDVSLSMVPPPPKASQSTVPKPAPLPSDLLSSGGLIEVVEALKVPGRKDATAELGELKTRLESDPRPRYVVIKDGMDHGPFSAIELLQQIASHTFESHHFLVDSFSSDERPISDWEEFAPFAQHARLGREFKAEKQEIERVVVAESKATRSKALLIGVALSAVASLGVVVFYFAKPQRRSGELVTANDLAINIETDAGIKSGARPKAAGGRWTGGGVAGPLPDGVTRPQLRGGMSCEQAMDTYVSELKMSGNVPDLSAGAFGGVLNNGSYVIGCGAPESMTVSICAAIQNGRAVGVSVSTIPPDGRVSSCVTGAVRGMGFPSHPNLDVTRTVFKGN